MTTRMIRTALVTAILGLTFAVPGASQVHQEAGSEHEESHHSIAGRHRITIGVGHTHVSEGQIAGETQWLALASWAVNYDYWLSDRWALGLQNDVILEQFVVEHGEEEFIERETPVAVIPSVLFKPTGWLTLIGGVGVEFAGGHDLTVTRLGSEAGWHFAEDWELGGALVWDNKWDYYDSWGLAFTLSRFLGHGR
ncbi:MAG: hypothetical protein P8177_05045 [Gemmatimonadota bacterium]|jgi:hypothetical protein